MFASRSAGGADSARARMRAIARRGLAQARRLQGAGALTDEQRSALDRFTSMYARLRSDYLPRAAPSRFPPAKEIDTLVNDALKGKIFADFFQTLGVDGDFDRAAVTTTRTLLARFHGRGGNSRARITAQVFQQHPALRAIGEICEALCDLAEPMPEPAWTLLRRNDFALVMRWAPAEYFELAFANEPGEAAEALTRLLGGELDVQVPPDSWLKIAYYALNAGATDLAEQTLTRAAAAIDGIADEERGARLRSRHANLADWVQRARRAAEPVTAPPGAIPMALVGVRHPDLAAVSTEIGDPIDALAVLGAVLRQPGVQLTGEPALVAAAAQLGPATGSATGDAQPTVCLYEIERDLSRYAAVPDGTWTIVSEWFANPVPGSRPDMPLDPRLRPIFISFHITPRQLALPGVVEYLRAHGPIGCRDRDTVLLLLAAGVPAFFSGALSATVHTVVGRGAGQSAAAGARLTSAARQPADVAFRSLGANLLDAADELRSHRDGGATVATGDVRLHLAARAIGCDSQLSSAPDDYRAIDFAQLSDSDLHAMQRGIDEKLDAVLAAMLAGGEADAVYAAWRAACASEVAQAATELDDVGETAQLDFDLGEAADQIRSAAITMERTETGPGGAEVNVEFSVDENYRHQLEIVLDSVVENATRPVRAFVMCRGLTPDYFERVAGLFPTVSFVWLPTDNVRYGQISGKIKWATIVTMDRTILPVVLTEIDRIIHFDLDALCLGDLAELFDVDMESKAIAAADEPQANFASGADTIRDTAARLRREDRPDLAREALVRLHAQHPFDFDIFNAGIMVLDLAKMREENFCGRFLAYVQRWGINGQVVLNVYVGRERKKIDRDWNRLVRLEIVPEPKVAHWAGPHKPWGRHNFVRGRELWRGQEERFAARTAATSPVETT